MVKELMMMYGICHGDEHLNNFMLTQDFDDNNFNAMNIKLIDFGKSHTIQKSSIPMKLTIVKSIFEANVNDLRYHKNCPDDISILLPNW
jgi:predicted unusual protein kinase regulating ubiquinone biosynthesis (AarF/ABC1/UbiB family)